ncbi:MAG: FkbM family methyltransferase [Candidatus Symbiothrix sp.]|jgi:FkbM family methyltransferase|nr:FkbM family methyltransferase [Candidatus Symbiothrix sp.]
MKILRRLIIKSRKLVKRILLFLRVKKLFSRHYYSEDGEDVLLETFYEHIGNSYKGFYIDIGAYHPIIFSNTQLFYEKGWRGINIDATPGAMKIFNRLRSRDINIEAGVSNAYGELEFYYYGKYSTGNTFSKSLSQERDDFIKFEKIIRVKVQPINDLLEKYLPQGQHIDFISMDVEDFEWIILETFDFEKYAPDYFLIEELEYENKDFMGYNATQIYTHLKAKGYMVVAKTRRTVFFKKVGL